MTISRERTKNELRCFCSRQPLLATYGVDQNMQLYIHVRIYKQRRIYGEVIVREGKVSLHCRECLRWHTVKIVQPNTAMLVEDTDPKPEVAEADTPSMLAPRAPEHLR